MASALGLRHVWLLNDLEASAHGIDALAPEDLLILHPGVADAAGNAALIAAGTGLGEAGLYWDGRRHRPFASEGGHATFAPTTDLETALHAHLRARFGHVSWERILSGPGLVHLYTFLRAHRRAGEPAWLTEEMAAGDAAAAITRAGLDGRSPVCSEALDLFVTLYGREAGNLALKLMATGGVYVGGGIAPRIQARLRGPAFVDAFRAKGRMASLLEAIPVRVILQDAAPLLGAARYAAMAAGGETP